MATRTGTKTVPKKSKYFRFGWRWPLCCEFVCLRVGIVENYPPEVRFTHVLNAYLVFRSTTHKCEPLRGLVSLYREACVYMYSADPSTSLDVSTYVHTLQTNQTAPRHMYNLSKSAPHSPSLFPVFTDTHTPPLPSLLPSLPPSLPLRPTPHPHSLHTPHRPLLRILHPPLPQLPMMLLHLILHPLNTLKILHRLHMQFCRRVFVDDD